MLNIESAELGKYMREVSETEGIEKTIDSYHGTRPNFKYRAKEL